MTHTVSKEDCLQLLSMSETTARCTRLMRAIERCEAGFGYQVDKNFLRSTDIVAEGMKSNESGDSFTEGDLATESSGNLAEGKQLAEGNLAAEGGGFLADGKELVEGDLATKDGCFAESNKSKVAESGMVAGGAEGSVVAEGIQAAECGGVAEGEMAAEGGMYLVEAYVGSWVLFSFYYMPPDALW